MESTEELENNLLKETLRSNRLASKIASRTDKSQSKKTDMRQNKTITSIPDSGIVCKVISVIADILQVACKNGKMYSCTIRGILKKYNHKTKNIAVVGDEVNISCLDKTNGVITFVHDRRNEFVQESQKKNWKKVIAANIDILVITLSAEYPEICFTILDRYLFVASKNKMIPIILINKHDVMAEKNETTCKSVESIYGKLGIKIICSSAKTGEGIKTLLSTIKGFTSALTGPSGTGKSSVINKLTNSNLRTGHLSCNNQGKHTTRHSQLLQIDQTSFVVDTPGIGLLNPWNIDICEVKKFFKEIFGAGKLCKYSSCNHCTETDCMVKHMVAKGSIANSRYKSYIKLLQEIRAKRAY